MFASVVGRSFAISGLTLLMAAMAGKPAKKMDPEAQKLSALTPRERDVIREVTAARGAKGAVIAERLGMSEHTLRNHLNAIYDKLGIHGRVELFIYASAHGLCGREPADQQPDLRLSARGSASGRS